MRLESALYSSREGLFAHGQAISVIGDNVSNVSTTGYKTARVQFSDIFASGQSLSDATENGDAGNGVRVGTVQQLQDSGVLEPTGRPLDVGIAGTGFFLVGDPAAPSYTRAGNFHVDADGQLVNDDGLSVLGYTGPTGTTLGKLTVSNTQDAGTPTSSVTYVANLNSASKVTTLPSGTPASFKDVSDVASFVTPIDINDSLGGSHSVNLYFFKTAQSQWSAQAYMDGGEFSGGTAGKPVLVGSATLPTFTGSGDLASAAATLQLSTGTYANGASPTSANIDLSGITQFAATSQTVSLTQDGVGIGNVKEVVVEKDGSVVANLSNGTNKIIGRLPLATFRNVDGLQRQGNTLYSSTAASGTADIKAPGETGRGVLQGGSLERSTVDISDQFINLVLFQRAYQANSQTLSVTNEILRDTIQLMR